MGDYDGSSATCSTHGRHKLTAKLVAVICAALLAAFAIGGYAIAGEGGEKATTASEYFSGSGTEDDPYLIEDADDLVQLSTLVNGTSGYASKYYKLAADIDMSSVSNFTPIGTNTTAYIFSGTLDGDGYTIENLTIDSTDDSAALIAYANGATVKNLTISGSITSSGQYVGGIVGVAKGTITITNCGNEASITCTYSGTSYVGGIIARNYISAAAAVTIDSCYNSGAIVASGDVDSNTTGVYAGGIIGEFYYKASASQTLSNCYNTGSVTVLNGFGAGGIVGRLYNSGTSGTITVSNCYNSGTVSLSNVSDKTLTSSTSYADRCGAILGYIFATSSQYASYYKLTNCYYLDSSCSQAHASLSCITSDCTAKTSDEMADASFVTALNGSGSAYVQGTLYPILQWQAGDGTPRILTDLGSDIIEYVVGDTDVSAMSITAALPATGMNGASGTLSYQWYSSATGTTDDGVAIDGATESSYTPSTSTVGDFYYYCVVTNTWTDSDATEASTASITSSVAHVLIHTGTASATPTIDSQPVSIESIEQEGTVSFSISASVSGDGAGTLSYQWYSVVYDDEGVAEVTAIDGATETTYVADNITLGTAYYQCVVTNTFEQTLTASVSSDVVSVTITPIYISSAADLKALADRVDAGDTCEGLTFAITTDINLQSDSSTKSWDPIGSTTTAFEGTLDGQGYTISGLSVDQSTYAAGLFAALGAGATVQDLTIEGDVTGSDWAGGLAGTVLGTGVTITNVGCEVNVTVTGSYAGGLVGYIPGTSYTVTVDDSFARGTVSAKGSYAGGLFGYIGVSSATITDVYFTGSVEAGESYAGGIAGCAEGKVSTVLKLRNAYAASTVTCGDSYAGTLAGSISHAYIYNCYTLEDDSLSAYGDKSNVSSSMTTLSASEMLSTDFPSMLGSTDSEGNVTTAFLYDSASINEGYPILEWEYIEGTPVITTQPEDVYTVRNADETLVIEASAPEETSDGVITYQWYSNTTGSKRIYESTLLEGETSSTFSVPTGKDDAGTTYYFCVVTNTFADGSVSISSRAAEVTVISAIEAATPQVSSLTGDVEYDYGDTAAAIEVSATMDSEGAGELSYQWYVSDTRDNDVSSATAIEDATESSYTPSTSTVCTKYYFCVVTNTFEDVKTASATSLPVEVIVGPFTLETADDVVELSERVAAGDSFEGITVTVVADIDMSGVTDYTPIGTADTPFAGTVEGDGYTIYGLAIDSTETAQGLFGYTDGATIGDLGVSGTITTTANYAGGIVASATDTAFENVTFTGTLSSSANYVGGIAGSMTSCTVYGATTYGSYSGSKYIGGCVGYAGDGITISYSTNYADLDSTYASSADVGGIVGYANLLVTLDHLANYGDITAVGYYVGGIVGVVWSTDVSYTKYPSTVTECKNAGDITSTCSTSYTFMNGVGGIVGCFYADGGTEPGCLSACYNVGDVYAPNTNGVSGIIGNLYAYDSQYTIVADCYSTGEVTGSSYYGDIFGYIYYSSDYTSNELLYVENCYGADDSTEGYGNSRLYPSSLASFFTCTVENQLVTIEQIRGDEALSDGSYVIDLLNDGINGEVFVEDTESVNDGFPLLEWETEETDSTVYGTATVTVASSATVVITNVETGHNYSVYATDDDGNRVYTLPVGTYTWTASLTGYYDVEGDLEVSEDGVELSIEFSLALPVFELSVSVTTEDGTAFTGTVSVYDTDGTAVELDEDGTASVCAGYYQYVVEMDGYVTQAATFQVLDDDVALAIVLPLDVEPVELESSMVAVTSIVETGEAQVPAVTVTAEDWTVLTEGYDYTVSYTDAEGAEIDASQIVSAGTYYVVVTGQYYYTGSVAVAFEVIPSVAFADVSVDGLVYAGDAVSPVVTAVYGDTELVEGEDYTVSYTDADGVEVDAITSAGTYYAVLTGTGSYGGTLTVELYVATSVSLATVEDVTAAYAGEAIAPAVTVTYGDAVLVEGTDYTVTYVDADGVESDSVTAAGTYTVVVTGTGDYAGTTTATLTVTADLSLATVSAEDAVYAGGSEVTTTVTVTVGETVLVEGEDYELSYSDNVEIGTATVTVTGLGACSGTATATFEIVSQYTAADLVELADEGTALIGSTEVSDDGTDVYTDATWATQDVIDALQAAVDAAVAAATSGDQQAMQDAGEAIDAALAAYEASAAAGSKEYVTGARWTRLGGTNRYGTNALAVSAAYGSSDVAVLASGQVAADALAASGLAGMLDAPVVLTKASELTDEALETIESLEATTVYVMGGTSAVSDDVVSSLEALGLTVVRVSGTNRVLTAIEIYETGAALGTWSTTAIVVNGFSTADALSASAYSYATESPIFMTNKDGSLSDETLAAISAGGFSQVYVVGGEGVVSAEALEALSAIDGVSAERIAGSNRYATSAAMVELCLSEGMSLTHAVIACGSDESFADALSGGSLAGSTNSVIMLVKEADSGSNSMVCVDDIVSANATSVVSGYILGGTGVFSSDFYEYVNSLD